MGRAYAAEVSDGSGQSAPASLRLLDGCLRIDGPHPEAIDIIEIDGLAKQDVTIGLRVHPDRLIAISKLGRDFEIFFEELRAERRRRTLTSLYLRDESASKCFPCTTTLGADSFEGDVEIYPTSLLFFPSARAPFSLPLSYVTAVGFDQDSWSVTLELVEGSKFRIGKLGKLTGEIRERLAIAMSNHAARARRLCELLGLPETAQPGIPLRIRSPQDLQPHALQIRCSEIDLIMAMGDAWLCMNELNSGMKEAADRRAIPDDRELLENCVVYLAIEATRRTVLEVINKEDYATYVFIQNDPSPLYPDLRFEKTGLMHLIRALDSINFRREPVYEDDGTLMQKHGIPIAAIMRKNPSVAHLRRTCIGRAIHAGFDAWREQLESLLR